MTSYENIPEQLKSLNQWVCACEGSKIPMCSFENEAASSTKPETWSDFRTAQQAVLKGYYDYCGFVFADNGIVGIDIDTGYDEYGLMNQLSADIIGRCRSYTEKSKSGRGFHVLLLADLPFKGRNNLKGVEIYKASRYFIMTGNVILYRDLIENQDAVDYVIKTYFPETKKSGTKDRTPKIYRPQWRPPVDGRFSLRPVYPRVTPGSRNLSMTSLAGAMHNVGYNKKQIYEELLIANRTACDPPLERSELQTICNSVTRYKR